VIFSRCWNFHKELEILRTSSIRQRYSVGCFVIVGQLKDIVHENLNVFVGACVDPPNICLVWHYCPKGSLQVTARDSYHLHLGNILQVFTGAENYAAKFCSDTSWLNITAYRRSTCFAVSYLPLCRRRVATLLRRGGRRIDFGVGNLFRILLTKFYLNLLGFAAGTTKTVFSWITLQMQCLTAI